MPYRDKDKQKKAVKRAVDKHRKGITSEGITEQGITSKQDTYPPILHAITDPIKRKKLEAITHSLKEHHVEGMVYYGCGKDSVSFDIVGDYLEATRLA